MIKSTTNKMHYIKSLINIWLQDPKIYCNNCGLPAMTLHDKCCESPQIGKNIDHCMAVIKQNEGIRNSCLNDYASDSKKTMQCAISLPPELLHFLEMTFKRKHNEKFLNDRKELIMFMRNFPQFRIPRKV